jgi:hypothetical protein
LMSFSGFSKKSCVIRETKSKTLWLDSVHFISCENKSNIFKIAV